MRFKLSITTDNAAFEGDENAEVARILRGLADRLGGASPDESYPLRDVNGNRVGEAKYTASPAGEAS